MIPNRGYRRLSRDVTSRFDCSVLNFMTIGHFPHHLALSGATNCLCAICFLWDSEVSYYDIIRKTLFAFQTCLNVIMDFFRNVIDSRLHWASLESCLQARCGTLL